MAATDFATESAREALACIDGFRIFWDVIGLDDALGARSREYRIDEAIFHARLRTQASALTREARTAGVGSRREARDARDADPRRDPVPMKSTAAAMPTAAQRAQADRVARLAAGTAPENLPHGRCEECVSAARTEWAKKKAVRQAQRVLSDGTSPDPRPVHGRGKTYRAGCRCELCVAAIRRSWKRDAANQRQRAALLAAGLAPAALVHATTTYDGWGCRCAPCVAAHRKTEAAIRAAAATRSYFEAHQAEIREWFGQYRNAVQTASLPTATRRGQLWTSAEMETAARADLTAVAVAELTDRTVYGVTTMRQRIRSTTKESDRG